MMQSIGANTKTYSLNSYDHVYAVAEKPLVKNLKMNLINTYEFIEIDEIDLEFLDDFINPGQYIVR